MSWIKNIKLIIIIVLSILVVTIVLTVVTIHLEADNRPETIAIQLALIAMVVTMLLAKYTSHQNDKIREITDQSHKEVLEKLGDISKQLNLMTDIRNSENQEAEIKRHGDLLEKLDGITEQLKNNVDKREKWEKEQGVEIEGKNE